MAGLIAFVIGAILLVGIIFWWKPKRKNKVVLPENYRELLHDYVAFYRSLNDADNLRYVLIYEDAFNEDSFSTTDIERNIWGMIGTGAMQQMMILSKPALLMGFLNEAGTNNTGIHEFVHLLDKADGATDGIPEQLLSRQYTIPWLNLMNETIEKIKQGNSDINPYGATSKTEFFAVAAEYFFQRPDLFKENHPELFALMEQIFHQRSQEAVKTENAKVRKF